VPLPFLGVPRGKNLGFRAILRFKLLICQSVATNSTKLAKKVYLGVLQHPTKFQAKIMAGKFIWEKNQNIH